MKTEEQFFIEKIQPGDLVAFANYGYLYVTNIYQNCFWVTDLIADRYDSNSAGWSVSKFYAFEIIEKGKNHEDIRIL